MARKLDTMKIQVISGPAQVISGPAQVISGPGWAWSMSPWNQESMRTDEVLGPWDPGWGERAAPGGRRPTNWGSGGGAPRSKKAKTYFFVEPLRTTMSRVQWSAYAGPQKYESV